MKNKNINVRLTDENYQAVYEIADKYNKSLSEVVRLAINNELDKLGNKRPMDKIQYITLMGKLKTVSNDINRVESQITGIARNINQLTKYTHKANDDRVINVNRELLNKYLNILENINTELKEISSKGWGNV